ncbi:hypothetical protein GWI33_004512 [Rhynchophorus ferrugineus]|uniref:Salivary secreted peptide n=1 Tax=Rhynchophorus ferrugineus TaxID=354439 RepID=A0A834MEK3_RHYFE|nr:hypothetical protein GWI33_004512 [Rhynchophorus ferrugineus]
MAARFALVFVIALVVFQFLVFKSDATVVRRDTAAAQNNTLEDALNSLTKGFQEMIANIQQNELFQNTTKVLQEFGEKVQQQGQELVNKIKTNTAKTN